VSGGMSQRCPPLSLSASAYRQIHDGTLYSALMFVALIIGHHFSILTFCSAPRVSGV
jgi:hypothetical protein